MRTIFQSQEKLITIHKDNFIRWGSHAFLVFLALVNICCSNNDAPSWDQIKAANKKVHSSDATKSSQVTTDDLVVYLDTSSPMKAYVRADGQTVFSQTLRTLREFATTLSPPVNVQLRTVATTVGALQSNIELANASTNQGAYNGTETNLAGAINVFSQSLQSALPKETNHKADSTSSPAPIASQPGGAPRFHVLITDGVQFSHKQNSSVDCASGSDSLCVRKKILSLLAQGWGASVIGLRSEFCCSLFSEKKQKSVAFDTKGKEKEDWRPFYLYIFSPDPKALDIFVGHLKENLRRAVGSKGLVLRELPITSTYADGLPIFDKAAFQTKDKSKLYCQRGNDKEALCLSLHLAVDSKEVKVPFELPINITWSQHAKDCGSPQELASVLQWELQPVLPIKDISGQRYAEIKLGSNQAKVDEKGNIIIEGIAEWPRVAGTPAWRAYRLIGRLNQTAEAPWVRAWSTDLDFTSDSGNKTLDLTTALLGVWRNPLLEKQIIAEVYLRIGPQ